MPFYFPKVTFVTLLVSQKFHDLNTPSQKFHITFILFASICNAYVYTRLVFSSDTDFLHLLHYALIIFA